jgi:hypothetical protein
MEVGAGTSHTATFLRALGPEPWKAAYVQPFCLLHRKPLRRNTAASAASAASVIVNSRLLILTRFFQCLC